LVVGECGSEEGQSVQQRFDVEGTRLLGARDQHRRRDADGHEDRDDGDQMHGRHDWHAGRPHRSSHQ
jgi:hypothetical protein